MTAEPASDDRGPVLHPAARAVLNEGRQLHVGVLTTTGPHVTPELYSLAGDDLWFATAATTLKTRVLRRDPRAAALVRVGSRSVAVVGTTTDFDLGDPMKLVGQARHAFDALEATASFALRNAADLGAFARDLVAGRLGSRRPPRRVLVRLRPTAWALVDGTELAETGGDWQPAPGPTNDGPALLEGQRDAAVGMQVDTGLVVLPARVDAEATTATVPAALARMADVPADVTTRACVVVDDYTAPGPAAKAGLLLRGEGTATYDGNLARVTLDVERETTWDGTETHTEESAS